MEHQNLIYLNGEIIKIQHREERGLTRGIISVERSSGVEDKIPFVMAYDSTLQLGRVEMAGKVATRNVKDKNGNTHKKIFVSVNNWVNAVEQTWLNRVELNGVLCKKDVLRVTPFGKTIMDIVIAVNEENGKSYYPSAIVWEQTAEKLDNFPVGTQLRIKGRFQSREYLKENISKTAYEISVGFLEVIA